MVQQIQVGDGLGFNFETRYLVVVSDGNGSYILPYMVHPGYELVMRQRYDVFSARKTRQ